MSSILDALRKLEEEKGQQSAPQPVTPRPIESPAREPAPRRSRSRRPSRNGQDHSRKLVYAVPVAIFVLGVIWAASTNSPASDSAADDQVLVVAATDSPIEPNVARGVATIERIESDLRDIADESPREARILVSDSALSAPIQSADPEPVPVQPESIATPDRPVAEVVDTPVIADFEPAPAVREPIRVDVSPVPMEREPMPEPVVEPPVEVARVEPQPVEPDPEPYEEDITPARAEPSERYQKAMAVSNALRDGTSLDEKPEPVVEKEIRRYDIMTRTVRTRLGIPELRINMLMQPNERNPQPSALIDYNKVYVGEAIPGTNGRANLIGVDMRGVAIEVDGKRYYYPK